MYAIVSLLDPETDHIIRTVWKRFEEECGLTGIQRMDLPHFSWVVADSYHFDAVEEILEKVTREMPPIAVRSAGLGIFTGPSPVVYISLVKDTVLLNWHNVLWEKTKPHAVMPNALYHPASWVPHITLAYHESNPQQLGCAIQEIVYTPLNLEFTVHNLSLVYQTLGQDGIHKQYQLKEDETNG
jgi:2'-5' RNA ligase